MKNTMYIGGKFLVALIFAFRHFALVLLIAIVQSAIDFVSFWFNPKPKITNLPFKKKNAKSVDDQGERKLTVTVKSDRQFKKRQMHKRSRA
jgi:cell division protein FtsL